MTNNVIAASNLFMHSLCQQPELSDLLKGTEAGRRCEKIAHAKAKEKIFLKYEIEDFAPVTVKMANEEELEILQQIKLQSAPVKLLKVKGEEYYTWKAQKHITGHVDVHRLLAEDGYCFDFQISETETFLGIKTKIAHIKFVLQKDVKKQGNGFKMFNFINLCSSILFDAGVFMLVGWARRENQFDVLKNRGVKNWRATFTSIKDFEGIDSPKMTKILALYLRNNWILTGQQKENDPEIALLSDDALKMLFELDGEDAAEAFKFSKNYEKIKSNYKV